MNNFSIYSLKGIKGQKAVRINYLDTFDNSLKDDIKDTPINKFDITDKIKGQIFACNITDKFLMSNKKLPFLYIKVSYVKNSIVNYPLYLLFVHFNVESNIQTSDDLLNKPVQGTFSSQIMFDKNVEDLDGDLGVFVGEEDFMRSAIELTKTELMTEIAEGIIKESESKFKERNKSEFGYSIPKNRIVLKDFGIEQSNVNCNSESN